MMARSSKGSNQRPDTLMRDRTVRQPEEVFLQRTAGPYIWVRSGAVNRSDWSGYVRFASKADVNSRNMARTARENAHPPRGRHDHSRRRDRGKSLARAQ